MFDAAVNGVMHDESISSSRAASMSAADGEVPDRTPNLAPVRFAEIAEDIGAPNPLDTGIANVKFPVRRVRAGETLYRAGDRFDAIYIVRAGFFKTVCVEANGVEQIMAFPMRGDAIGLDGVSGQRYRTETRALDTSLVVVVSLDRLASLAGAGGVAERLLHFIFSREMRRQQDMMLLLGSFSAEARVAAFLLQLADKFGRLGFSRTSYLLKMSRQEIGSYLGIKLETVSRTLSALASAGLIRVDQKSIRLLDAAALRERVVSNEDASRPARPSHPSLRRAASSAARAVAPALA